jgi:hypothetical protein
MLTRTLLPWLAVHEMRDMEMVTTSTVSVRTKDNCRNLSPDEFGGLLSLLASSRSILTFQPGSLHSPWELQTQRFADA